MPCIECVFVFFALRKSGILRPFCYVKNSLGVMIPFAGLKVLTSVFTQSDDALTKISENLSAKAQRPYLA